METCHVWKAENYHHHSSVQYNSAMELLQLINLKKNSKVLDIGCGEGKISAKIALEAPYGVVVGIDKSSEMIEFARRHYSNKLYQNLSFCVQDAQYLSIEQNFDFVFSSFALQWVLDKYSFFERAYKILENMGSLVITVPLNVSPTLEAVVNEIILLPEWINHFRDFSPGWYMANEDEYKKLIITCGFTLKYIKVNSLNINFQSRQHFENYILPWFTYVSHLPENLRESFFKAVVDRYIQVESYGDNGEVYLRFHRLDVIAIKGIQPLENVYD